MKYLLSVLLITLLAPTYISAQSDGWISLFNGQDLNNWTRLNGEADYRTAGDEIIGTTKMNTPNTFLATKQQYADFILELEVKLDASLNSGIQFRSLSKPDYQDGRVHGYQAEIDPSPRAYSGGIYDEARRGWLYPLSLNPTGQTAFVNGRWNHYRIEAIGPVLRIWVNGIQTANLVDDMTAAGFIALQVHSIGEEEQAGREVRWRNIRIKTTDLEKERRAMAPYAPELNLIPNTLTENEKRKGWRLLWDGQTTKGWRSARSKDFPARGWSIQDGVLTVEESGGAESEAGGDIITQDRFSDFELIVDFMITPGANSGIKYFVDPELNKGPGSSIGPEYQILDNESHADAKAGIAGNRTLGSLYDLVPATNLSIPGQGVPFHGVGKWNQARIIARGQQVEHWLNGYKIVEYERGTPMWRALVAYSKYKVWPNFGELPQGHILLQDHGNRVHFRNIKIREF